jgi:hypothetical protein
MKNNFKLLLFILIALLILSGLLLFAYRQKALDYLSSRAGFSDFDFNSVAAATAPETLDISILNSARLNSLTNNVVNFDFDNICRRPAAITRVVSENVSASTSAATIASCALGNGLPFAVRE